MKHKNISVGNSVKPLVRAMRLPALALSLDGRVVAHNVLAAESLGFKTADQIEDFEFICLLSAVDRVRFDHLIRAAEDGQDINEESFALHRRGSVGTFEISALRDDAGTLLGFLCQQSPGTLTKELLTWHSALSNGDHGLWEIDVPSAKCSFSDKWYDMRGRSRSEVALTNLYSLFSRVHEDDHHRLRQGLMGVFANETDTFSIEYRERHGDGHYIWILSRGRVVARDSNGQPIRFVGTDTDITSPKVSQNLIQDLTEREMRWKIAIEGADQGVWDHDLALGRRYVSDIWRTMRGMDPDDYVDKSFDAWLDDIHPDDVDGVRAEMNDLHSGLNDNINFQYRQRHKDGHWVWILSRGSVVTRTPEGGPARVIGTDTDISDIKKVEVENALMSDRLRVAMRAADMGRWEYNLREDTAYWDDRLLDMFGLKGAGNIMPGDQWGKLIHPDDQERAFAKSEESVKRGIDLALDYRVCRPDGEVRHVRSRAIFVKDDKRGDRFVGVNIDVTSDILRQEELEAARALLEYESRHDALTGLANRRGLDEKQNKFLSDNPEQRQAVLHIDLDNFKQINDTLGHGAGDAVLVHAAGILGNAVQDDWLAARVGGDEFVMLLPNAPPDAELEKIAGEIISQMSAPFTFDGQQCNFGVSIGIAVSEHRQAPDESLFVSADLALYAAKKDGRGKFRFFDIAMKESAADRKEAFDALLAGFEQGEIICHYQPQFDARTLELTGLEALVRWQSPSRGLLMPDTFLGTAEEIGMIAEIDALVLQRAHDDLNTWQDAGFDVPRVSVNVSAARLSDPDLIPTIAGLNLPEGKFAFELLESAFLDTYGDDFAENLSAIKDMGIEVEIDDFGTGHASIVSLLQVEPHRLKIDRQLIGPIVHSTRQRNLIQTIINIGQMQGVSVVAEGVETAEHASILKALGCDFLQGYALGRPVPFDEISLLLAALQDNNGRLILAA